MSFNEGPNKKRIHALLKLSVERMTTNFMHTLRTMSGTSFIEILECGFMKPHSAMNEYSSSTRRLCSSFLSDAFMT